MNKQELEQRLIKENIPKDAYYLNGGYPNESYCLSEVNGKSITVKEVARQD